MAGCVDRGGENSRGAGDENSRGAGVCTSFHFLMSNVDCRHVGSVTVEVGLSCPCVGTTAGIGGGRLGVEIITGTGGGGIDNLGCFRGGDGVRLRVGCMAFLNEEKLHVPTQE